MYHRGLSLAVCVALLSVPGLFGDQLQITAGLNGGGSCIVDCQNSPNVVSQKEIGIYSPGHKIAYQELLVFLVPDNNTDGFFNTNPISTINIYASGSSSPVTNVTATSEFATATNAGHKFGLGSGSQISVSDGFWGTVTSDSESVKVGKLLGIKLNGSINMENVSNASEIFSNSTSDQFGIYTFLINAALGKGQLVDIQFSGLLPAGTYIAAVTDTGLSTQNNSAGLVDPPAAVPEPISIVLLATVAGWLSVRSQFLTKSKIT